MVNKKFAAISVLVGTVIGAGILGIPYVIMKSGFTFGLLNLIIVAAMIIITHLYLGEISLRTKTNHHLAGYAEKYLGKKGKYLMFFAFSFGAFAALLAYIIGESVSLSHLFFQTSQYSLLFGIGFWIFMSILTHLSIKALEEGEELGIGLIIILMAFIVIAFWNKIDVSNLTYLNMQNIFLPFGVILFAFLGFSAIPEIERILYRKQDKKLTKSVIIISNLVILAIYIIFTLIVLGSQGASTPQIATIALGKPFIILGILTMFTSYLAISFALIDTFRFDFNKTRKQAWIYTTIIPIILFVALSFIEGATFIKILGLGGAIAGGLTATLILAMVKQAKKKGNRKPEYQIPYSKLLTIILIILFAAGAIMEILNSL